MATAQSVPLSVCDPQPLARRIGRIQHDGLDPAVVLQRVQPLGDRRVGRIAENLGESQHGGQLTAIRHASKGGRSRSHRAHCFD